jgi:hypothetical protein
MGMRRRVEREFLMVVLGGKGAAKSLRMLAGGFSAGQSARSLRMRSESAILSAVRAGVQFQAGWRVPTGLGVELGGRLVRGVTLPSPGGREVISLFSDNAGLLGERMVSLFWIGGISVRLVERGIDEVEGVTRVRIKEVGCRGTVGGGESGNRLAPGDTDAEGIDVVQSFR